MLPSIVQAIAQLQLPIGAVPPAQLRMREIIVGHPKAVALAVQAPAFQKCANACSTWFTLQMVCLQLNIAIICCNGRACMTVHAAEAMPELLHAVQALGMPFHVLTCQHPASLRAACQMYSTAQVAIHAVMCCLQRGAPSAAARLSHVPCLESKPA